MSEKSGCRRLSDKLKCNQLRISRNIIVLYYRDCCRCWAGGGELRQQATIRRTAARTAAVAGGGEESTTITRHSEHHCYIININKYERYSLGLTDVMLVMHHVPPATTASTTARRIDVGVTHFAV